MAVCLTAACLGACDSSTELIYASKMYRSGNYWLESDEHGMHNDTDTIYCMGGVGCGIDFGGALYLMVCGSAVK